MLEILIEREERKNQGAFNFALNVQDLEAKDDSSLRTAAELFLSWEFKSPYFFGSSTLTRLASSNIEQFLWLAGDEFEEVASANVINPKEVARLSPERQESILRKASQFLWDEFRGDFRADARPACCLNRSPNFQTGKPIALMPLMTRVYMASPFPCRTGKG